MIQAIGTGMIVPLGMNLTLVVAPEGKIGTYMGAVSAMTTLGPALGPIVAGVVLHSFSWHALFVLFAILVAIGLVLAAIFTFALSRLGESAQAWRIIVFYLLVILGVALTMGPTQTFALSRLDRDLYPHGVAIVSTGFQIAGCLGSSLFMGVLSLTQEGAMAGGAAPAAAMASGFSASCLLATGFACVGFVIARNERKPCAAQANADGTVLDAVELFVGFVSDGDVMRALSKQTPLFQSAWSFMAERDDGRFATVVNKAMDAPVMQIATRNVIGVDVHDDLETVCKILADKHLKKAPVFDGGRMVGMINRSNITRRTTWGRATDGSGRFLRVILCAAGCAHNCRLQLCAHNSADRCATCRRCKSICAVVRA
ncbi:MFS family major facilitator transporter [Bifidobacterium cuniculi]|uniref:MFS family major facilitator transporter n=1 Tax=Bifidobacterium cuniculi TaxID=1688 RepID=A0A087APP6_9BIFI|nr:MFS family major facilitator transporter [Bifidobacterium cuniculi]